MHRARSAVLLLLPLTACEDPTRTAERRTAPSVLTAASLAACPSQGDVIITDLGMLPGDLFSRANDINASGQVVGESGRTDVVDTRAFLWTAVDGFQDLGVLPGDVSSAAFSISDRGQVAGVSRTRVGFQKSFRWRPIAGMQHIRALDEKSGGSASGINNEGQVVGFSFNLAGEQHGYLWAPGGSLRDLGDLGGDFSVASAVDDAGRVAGTTTLRGSQGPRAFLWTQATGMRNLGTLRSGEPSSAAAINNSGQVVGGSANRAFLWTAARGMRGLGTLRGGDESFALAINDNGDVVGRSTTSDGSSHAFLWTETSGMRDLGTLPRHDASMANAVNDRGQIVGTSTLSTEGFAHAVIWTVFGRRSTFATILALGAETQSLVPQGKLSRERARSLGRNLERVQERLNRSQERAAAGLLRAFVASVRALVRRGELQRADGQPLIDLANCAIDELRG